MHQTCYMRNLVWASAVRLYSDTNSGTHLGKKKSRFALAGARVCAALQTTFAYMYEESQ